MFKIGQIGPREIFDNRVSAMRTGFPEVQKKFNAYHLQIAAAEEGRASIPDSTMVSGIKITRGFARRRWADIKAAMDQAPELKLPKDVLTQFTYVYFIGRLLLSRIERLRIENIIIPESVELPDYDPEDIKLGPGKKII